jgi:hypothetical protein
MDVIGHNDPSLQFIEPLWVVAIANRRHNNLRDSRIAQPLPLWIPRQRTVLRGECMTGGCMGGIA